MKRVAPFILLAAFAAGATPLPQLPAPQFADTEVSTNCPINALGGRFGEYTFTLSFNGTPSNCVEVALGTDANANGVVSAEETDFAYGWRNGRRFLSADPAGLSGGLNLYAYAEGNPLAYIDPLGLCAGESKWGKLLTRKGGVNRVNHILSGKWQPSWMIGDNTPAPFNSGIEYTVPKSSLSYPNGWEIIKAPLGQRIYTGPTIPPPQ